MRYIIENENIGLGRTSYEQVDKILAIEAKEHSRFIVPYDKNRHLKIIDSMDEEHICIWDKSTCELLGYIILWDTDNPNLSVELRRILIENKSKGIGKQSLRLLKQYCFDNMNFHRLWLDVFEDNERGIKLFKSENFQEEGRLRDVIKQGDKYRTRVILSSINDKL